MVFDASLALKPCLAATNPAIPQITSPPAHVNS